MYERCCSGEVLANHWSASSCTSCCTEARALCNCFSISDNTVAADSASSDMSRDPLKDEGTVLILNNFFLCVETSFDAGGQSGSSSAQSIRTRRQSAETSFSFNWGLPRFLSLPLTRCSDFSGPRLKGEQIKDSGQGAKREHTVLIVTTDHEILTVPDEYSCFFFWEKFSLHDTRASRMDYDCPKRVP